jgi:hypothetical protein
MLGPGVNILRTPLCGRNIEYLGEDPFLSSRMAVGFIRVVSCVVVGSPKKEIGSAGRTRTYNPRINSALLHH